MGGPLSERAARRMHLGGRSWRFVRQAVSRLTAGRLDAEQTEYAAVLKNPASRHTTSANVIGHRQSPERVEVQQSPQSAETSGYLGFVVMRRLRAMILRLAGHASIARALRYRAQVEHDCFSCCDRYQIDFWWCAGRRVRGRAATVAWRSCRRAPCSFQRGSEPAAQRHVGGALTGRDRGGIRPEFRSK